VLDAEVVFRLRIDPSRRRGRILPDVKRLARFDVEGSGREFTLHITDEAGHTLVLRASHDQLDILADVLDDALLGGGPADPPEDR
jgi:hypothetical protein